MIKKYSYIIETLLFSAFILVAGFASGNPAYIGIQFHPFYFVILLIASRYGYVRCLVSSAILGLVYLLFYVPGTDTINFWAVCYQPLAFMAFGMFVGLLVEVDKKDIGALNGNIDNLNEMLRRKQQEIAQIVSLNANLSEQLAVSDKTFNVVFRETRAFYNEDMKSIYEAAFGVLSKVIKASRAFVFYLDGTELKLACPAAENDDSKVFMQKNRTRIEEVSNHHEFIRLDSNVDHDPAERVPVLMGPILHHETDTLYGIVVIEEMDFLTYNENTYLTFKNLCQWLGDVFHFRSSTPQSSTVNVGKIDSDFNFLLDYGAPRERIRAMVEQILSDGGSGVAVTSVEKV